jgi:hypothetical protein
MFWEQKSHAAPFAAAISHSHLGFATSLKAWYTITEKCRPDGNCMTATQNPPTPVNLRHPLQYVFSFMANRYALEPDDGFTLAHFGLVNRSGLLIDQLSCALPEHTLQSQKENLVQYSDSLGLPKNEIPSWRPSVRDYTKKEMNIPVVDFVHLIHWEDAHAEICFWNWSHAALSDLVRVGKPDQLLPFGVAMIRCSIDLQRAFLIELYKV